ncbi:U-box domain-containing protein 44 isoform X1 [Manihot esculenta]|uniref:Uncharacterized protein n=2 Tax=Manihot esculenta TaxID=3983 RepID=A0ACC8EAC5_MANES|nr:U-box domain-containing protein 44 isoform X1 [Manihot esculenta]OAY62511.2 hypothetical protein MANES_01G160501v8 [Manihot esculenta]
MMSSPPISAAIDSIHLSLTGLCSFTDPDSFENSRLFSGYARRLQLLFNHLLRSFSPQDLPASVRTALKGISIDLSQAAETVSLYRKRCKIFVLVNCHSLRASLQDRTTAIGAWLALIESSLPDDVSDLRKKTADLSRDMKQAHFRVTENEERVHRILEKEAQGKQTTKAVQSAIVMDLARALGIDSENNAQLAEQVRLLKCDLALSNSVLERRILVSLERILENWSNEPDIATLKLDLHNEDDAYISPLKNFLCPLTKEVMKEPVVLESSQTYERKAINHWFHRCIEDGREPTCPVTGQVLKSLEVKPNIGLAGAIEEWTNRIIEVRVKSAVEDLSREPVQVDCIERALDNIYKISEEHPSNRYRVRSSGAVVLIIKLLKNSSKSIGTNLRAKSLSALLSMTKDEESKKIMLEGGVTRLAIHGLIGSSEKEREYAVKLLLEFTSDEAYCIKIASEKGALVLLSSMAGNLEFPALSKLAEEVLKRMERLEDNIQPLAAAGRFEPLLTRLCEGSDDVKIEMASIVGRMTLTNGSKEQIARQSAKILVELLSKPEGRAPSLQALYNLSSLDDNATILVDSAVLPALTDILFENQKDPPELEELASATMANIVSNPGHWELAYADSKGNSLQSESFIFSLLGLLSVASPHCQVSVLRILCGIASSPQAAESVTAHIKFADGIKTIIPFLEHPEVELRINAFRITSLLSGRFGQQLLHELKPCNKLPLLKEKLLDDTSTDGERSDAASILANLPLSEDEVKALLGASFVRWAVLLLKNLHRGTNGRISRPAPSMIEGILGLLLHFTKNLDQQTLGMVREYHLMTIFCEQLCFPSKPRAKQLSSLGLKNLSEACKMLTCDRSEPPPRHGLCASWIFMCGSGPPKPSTCPFHSVPCDETSQLCLLKSNCIKPLVDLLTDKDTNVQIAAVETLSTLVPDTANSCKRAIDELEQQGVVDAVIVLFTEVRPGDLQEKAIWMIDRILRVEGCSHRHSLNQSLVRALVEAFKHGNANTKRHAQDALINLKQLSCISGKSTSQAHSGR